MLMISLRMPTWRCASDRSLFVLALISPMCFSCVSWIVSVRFVPTDVTEMFVPSGTNFLFPRYQVTWLAKSSVDISC